MKVFVVWHDRLMSCAVVLFIFLVNKLKIIQTLIALNH
jgi:hypothetical protein